MTSRKPSLAETHPEVASQADGWDPKIVTASSGLKRSWRCNLGHKWVTKIYSRTDLSSGCPTCSGRIVQSGFNDLKTLYPDIASQAHGWDPTTVTKGSKLRKEWICALGHTWIVAVHTRTGRDKTGCPFCSNRKVKPGFNDLATKHPDIASQAHGWDPTKISSSSNKKVEWRCIKGHVWSATVGSRTDLRSGCPICIGRKVLIGFNDLATTHPKIAREAYGWDPTSVSYGSNIKKKWWCEKGHEYVSSVAGRVQRNRGCPYCAGQKILVGFNDLSTTDPNVAAEAFQWDPSTVTRATNKKRKWICALGHKWNATVASRTKEDSGCPSCAKPGFDPNSNAWFYFLENVDTDLFQIGISNQPDQRLSKHARGGWTLLEIRGPMLGQLAQDLEFESLKALAKRGAILAHKAGIKKFDGYTEAWTKQSLNVSSIKQILDWVHEDEAS